MSVLDDDPEPLVTVPSTNLDTGNWDADGPLAGWRVERDRDGRILDYVIESTWERKGCFCLLTRVTEYIVLGRYHGPERIGESETYYRGYVHAPGVESLPKGCYGRDSSSVRIRAAGSCGTSARSSTATRTRRPSVKSPTGRLNGSPTPRRSAGRGAMSEYSAGVRQKLGWLVWAIAYEAYCAVRYPGRRWRMECPYCASDHTARSWNMAVLKTDIHVSNADSNAHGSGDATTAADFPEDEDRENPTLEASGGWSA